MFQITLGGLRNATWCLTAFGIVACAAPLTPDRLMVANQFVERAEDGDAAHFTQMELPAARSRYSAAQAAADQRDAELAAMLADQVNADAQLAEYTERAHHSRILAGQADARMRNLAQDSPRPKGGNAPALTLP